MTAKKETKAMSTTAAKDTAVTLKWKHDPQVEQGEIKTIYGITCICVDDGELTTAVTPERAKIELDRENPHRFELWEA